MRLFLAVDLDEPARDSVARAAARLRQRAGQRPGLARTVTWVDARNLHLTLHFIGELDDDRLPTLRLSLSAPLGVEPARIGFGGWGVFPGRGAARVIWIGVTDGVETLARVHAVLGDRLTRAGIVPEARPFSPHLTVGRVKVAAGTAWADIVREDPPVACGCTISHCTLYRSHLASSGPTYEAVLRIPFRDAVSAPPDGSPPRSSR
jgi:2'-5' RNA ligase